ncbi:MAG: hypothetical protein GX622_03615 [Bacteroidales bacterium]|nr:hypothetical protein [Bacteroidales bacterium]
MVKDAEGNVYKTVKIGDQVWMKENLRTRSRSRKSLLQFHIKVYRTPTASPGKPCFNSTSRYT